MGFFSGQNRTKSKSTATTLLAEGCSIRGDIKVTNQLQIDGHVEGLIEADHQIKISTSGRVLGDITTERLIVNGYFEGTCHATYVEILRCGHVSGSAYSDNLSIELGGKFVGVTNPTEEKQQTTETSSDEQDINQQHLDPL